MTIELPVYNGPLRGQTLPVSLFYGGSYDYIECYPVIPSCIRSFCHDRKCVYAHEISIIRQKWTHQLMTNGSEWRIESTKAEWL